jgi:hypothetical protein
MEEIVPLLNASLNRKTVLWCHDESTFYANDRRKVSV